MGDEMNQQRAQLLAATNKLHSDVSAANSLGRRNFDKAHLVAEPRTGVMKTFVERSSSFVPPKTREVATLVDWIADHPAVKGSKSLRKLQEAYLESIGIL